MVGKPAKDLGPCMPSLASMGASLPVLSHFAKLLLKRNKPVAWNYMPKSQMGLGLMNVRAKSLALFIKNILSEAYCQAQPNPNFSFS